MSLSELLWKIRPAVEQSISRLDHPWPACTLFLSLCDGTHRASVLHASGETFNEVWRELSARCQQLVARQKIKIRWLRADWVTAVERLDGDAFNHKLKAFKRNYFRFGLALDENFQVAFLEQELNANAMLYGGTAYSHPILNEKNFHRYASRRFPRSDIEFGGEKPVFILSTTGVYCDEDTAPVPLYPTGRHAGRRVINSLNEPVVEGLIESGARYLTSQVKPDGRFFYGWHPCFDRPINTYNTLRHASTTYSMLEAWEVTREPDLLAAIERSLQVLTEEMIHTVQMPEGSPLSFLVDLKDEIKLGGNAVCLLALTLYTKLLGGERYHGLMERLALGICHMQDLQTGRFDHVLNYPELSVKDPFRVIYYDGEAAFGLLRLYDLTGDQRWLEAVERAFEYFIEQEHWKVHDHWLAYSVNELTRHRPEERYYRFGIRNVAGHLDFIERRITTFPTLLELMMAARAMLERIENEPAMRHLLDEIDREHFQRALHTRAHYLLNGHFWPEYAMFFKNPARILGSFFIRHHAFRVRIDDVEHYLSGYVAYHRYLKNKSPAMATIAAKSKVAASAESSTSDILYARLAGFQVDIARLREHFERRVKNTPATPYRDHRVDYLGWAVTSRDGSTEDGVRRIALSSSTNRKRGTLATDICKGYLAEVMESLQAYGVSPYRARIMLLESEGTEMPFHTDARSETWRLHIPIVTNPEAYFEWRCDDGEVERVHMPADGSAWLVRVDVEHRAVNRGGAGGRTHLLMGLNRAPLLEMLGEPQRLTPGETLLKQPVGL